MKNFFISVKIKTVLLLGFVLIFSFCGDNNADIAVQIADKACDVIKLKKELEAETNETNKIELESEISTIEVETKKLEDKALLSYKDNPKAERLYREKYMKAFIKCDAMEPEMKKMMQKALETMESANK